MCWNDAYLILVLYDQCMGNFYNKVTHISIVVMHVGMEDMNTLLTQPCQMLFDKYYAHMECQSFICLE